MSYRSYPVLFRMVTWVVLPIMVALGATYEYLSRSLPTQEGILRVAGLESAVEVIRDKHAVPHIFAATDRDAFFAIGYLHAQERLWQMEYQRRLGQGRLSEIFGHTKLSIDQYMRTLGVYRAAKQAVQSLDNAARETLEAYVDGVNAWMTEGNVLPIEYHILGFEPEPWRPEDSLLQIKLMALDLDFNHRQELVFDLLVKQLGPERAADLMPSYSLSQGPTNAQEAVSDTDVVASLVAYAGGPTAPRLGSNAWVVAGELTHSGSPMLANDPHLATQIPAVWYLAEMRASRLHVAGATYPGLPFVVLGRNASIAWGGTALGADVQDLYMERTNPADEDQYEVDGQWMQMEVHEEWIRVKSEFPAFLTDAIPPLKWKVRRTRHGPLISDVIDRISNPLALRWTALDDDDGTYQSLLAINYAEDWKAFKRALKDYVAPTLNFVYADRKGSIGFIAAGKVPVRKDGNGKSPVVGWDSSYDWGTYLPVDALPQAINPEAGYLVSANNVNHAAEYPYLISNSWAPPYRASRISQVIESHIRAGRPLNADAFIGLQGDLSSLQAQELLTFIGALAPETPSQQHAIEQLMQWDGLVAEDSASAALYQSWFRHFNRLVVNDELTGDLLHPERLDVLQNFAERLNPIFIERVLSETGTRSGHRWCDQIHTAQAETCEDMALAALDRAVDEVMSLTGGYRQWGEIHEIYYEHRGFTDMQLLDYIFERVTANGGDAYSVNVGGWKYSNDREYEQSLGPSYRQVIDLADWSSSWFINNTGQSGNVLSRHYDDNIPLHKRLVLLPMHFRAEDVPPHGSTLLLEPAEIEGRRAKD